MRERSILLFAVAALFSGCSDGTPDVSGSVTLDNTPLADGNILFESEDGKTAPASATIKDGKYSLKVTPGPKKVRITAARASSKLDPAMGAPVMESIIPAAYNAQTTLKAEVKAGKGNSFDFPLKSKP